VIVKGTHSYVRALIKENMCMYVIFKGKNMYTEDDIDWERVRQRDLDIKKNRGCQATCNTKNQENR
jgi:hypothetical protein